MRVEKRISNTVTICVDGESHMELFTGLAELQEIFSEQVCQKCKKNDKDGTNISYRIRSVVDGKKTYEYPELVCNVCYAKFSFGQSDGGKLFPIRYMRDGKDYVRDSNGKLIEKGTKGWVKFNKETGKEE